MRSCSARIGSRSVRASAMCLVFVVHTGKRLELGSFLLRRRIVEKVSAADLGASEVLQQAWLSQWRMDLDVEVKLRLGSCMHRGLVESHYVWKRHSPEVLQPN